MPPKKSSHMTHTSSDDSEDASLVPSTEKKTTANSRIAVESSAIKKSRGRPRKQPTIACGISEDPQDPDNSLSLVSRTETHLETKKSIVDYRDKDVEKEKGKVEVKRVGTNGEDTLSKEMSTNRTKTAANRKKATERKLEIPETQAVCEAVSESDDMDISLQVKGGKTKEKTSQASGKIDPTELADELALLKLKYEKLRRLRTDDADAIQAEQVKALEERDKASQRIISNLKTELKSRSISLQQLEEKEKRVQELEEQNSLMGGKIERLLQDHAVLSAKLETARNIGKTPSKNSKTIAPSGASKEFSQHRENLYSDLCGLIVVNVKSDEDGGIEYDCLSTGKNGALHFKLQLDAEDDEDEVDDDGPYFTYNPMLERGRDERLMAVLPPIFREEMNFKRTRGVDFYLQLMQSLQSS
ncbi:hypothetical protein TWF506_007066 [Arthrobotrys conoides]|uniref:Monopolin complex subunit Csm1/Pcs1 C-terminal domain-containing protein n=1 Tax=Arthrobotrys conoides TaxID=74498 RepID=A0AAN8P4T0_9PEZI